MVVLPLTGDELSANSLVFDKTIFRPTAEDARRVQYRQARGYLGVIGGDIADFGAVLASDTIRGATNQIVARHVSRVLGSERFSRPAEVVGTETAFTLAPWTYGSDAQHVISRPVIITSPELAEHTPAYMGKVMAHQSVHAADAQLTSEARNILFPEPAVSELRALAASRLVAAVYQDAMADEERVLLNIDFIGATQLMPSVPDFYLNCQILFSLVSFKQFNFSYLPKIIFYRISRRSDRIRNLGF